MVTLLQVAPALVDRIEVTAISHQGQAPDAGPFSPKEAGCRWLKKVTGRCPSSGRRQMVVDKVPAAFHDSLQLNVVASRFSTSRTHPPTTVECGDVRSPARFELSEIPESWKIPQGGSCCDRRRLRWRFEVHAANGYLYRPVPVPGVNDRTDQYGSIENRTRFPFEVMDVAVKETGGGRTGIRISLVTSFGDSSDPEPQPLHACDRRSGQIRSCIRPRRRSDRRSARPPATSL